MYQWIVVLHVFFAFAFMLVHGITAAVMLSFRKESDPERIFTLFNILPAITITRGLTLLMGISGFIAAFLTIWWRQGWVWASFVVFLGIFYIMQKYGSGYYWLIQGAANRLIEARKTNTNVEEAQKEFDEARNAPHPMIVSVVGIAGLSHHPVADEVQTILKLISECHPEPFDRLGINSAKGLYTGNYETLRSQQTLPQSDMIFLR